MRAICIQSAPCAAVLLPPAIDVRPETPKSVSYLLRLMPEDRAARPRIWPWLIAGAIVLPLIVLLSMVFYGMTIPEYKSRARAARDVCIKYLAGPDQRDLCEENYNEALRQGRIESAEERRMR